MADLADEIEYLLRTETFTNGFGVKITVHPELGQVEWTERCAEFVEKHGPAIVAALRERSTASQCGQPVVAVAAGITFAAIIGCIVGLLICHAL